MKTAMFAIVYLMITILCSRPGAGQTVVTPADPEYYAMDREQINFDDYQLMLVNYRGFVCPRRYSVTAFTNVQFLPMRAEQYHFNLDFLDKRTGRLIKDDVPIMWKKWIDERKGFDPLGSNFRPNSPSIMVTQDERWQPNLYFRSGTFHKEYGGQWISFAVKSRTCVSYSDDEVFIKLLIHNRNSESLEMTLIPNQVANQLFCNEMPGSPRAAALDSFTIGSEQMHVRVSSDLNERNEHGFVIRLKPGQSRAVHFAVKFYPASEMAPQLFQTDIAVRMNAALQLTRSRLKWAYETLPQLQSTNQKLQEYYYRCLLSVLMSRYENPNYITPVFWAVGYWPFTISWDNSYSADILAMLDPQSFKETILTDFRYVKLKRTYVGWKGAFWDNLYIQEPFALQIMLEAYLRHTDDYSIFQQVAAGKTVWQWMQTWVKELQTNYTNEMGLIDIGYDTQKIIEIRTDGYNHVVPITNELTIHLLYGMSRWAEYLKDENAPRYFEQAEKLKDLVNRNLWNEQLGWFENLYPDGSKQPIWTLHLFDLLGTDHLSGDQIIKLVSHIQDGVFLGKYGVYSIARKDSVHWDLIDADWGGGGQYAGMAGRLARYLYKQGFAGIAWDILRRHMRYIDYFPYLPQNPLTDRPEQDRSSQPVEIASGAGMEAIIFGMFGLHPQKDKLIINPAYHEDLGESILRGYKYKDDRINIRLSNKQFSVFRNGHKVVSHFYGEPVILKY